MHQAKRQPRAIGPANRDNRPQREPLLSQLAGFVDLFVWLLVFKSFFLPLFIIPTGSMAATLAGANADHLCPNCGIEYKVGFQSDRGPTQVQCPNCRLQQTTDVSRYAPSKLHLEGKSGDRIVVHGWPHELGGWLGLKRWDVVVFRNPNKPRDYFPGKPHDNYIKRLIGLPGETIEIIDGDVFVSTPRQPDPQVARKTPHAQRSLWFPYYNHDYPPRVASQNRFRRSGWTYYHPRWKALAETPSWHALSSRIPVFDGANAPRGEMQFVTGAADSVQPGEVWDIYGYNAGQPAASSVSDVRLAANVRILEGDGYVELMISKYDDQFYATLHADGRLTLEHAPAHATARAAWGETRVKDPSRGARLSLAHADYQVIVELNGKPVLTSPPDGYNITAERARRRAGRRVSPTVRIAAEKVHAELTHLLISRDVYYTGSDSKAESRPRNGIQDAPITLADEYFCMGDNSPNSLDCRWWTLADLGPHTRIEYEAGNYTVGTVPKRLMIGSAFLVYWPGFMPLVPGAPNILPDFGRVRWIE